MDLKGKKILVTGADGFIGSHLTEELVKRGADVRAFVFYNSFNSWGWLDQSTSEIKQSLNVFAGDVRDGAVVKRAMEGCDIVFHLAALIAIPFSYIAPESYVDTNIKGTLNVLQAAKTLGSVKVIQVSTSEVYGTAQFVPITEKHPLCGQSPYAATKIGADQLALSFHKSFQLPVTVVRPFNAYGPRQSARAVIPTIMTQIESGSKKIKLGALKPTRDFNYVDDVVSGFISVANAEKAIGEVIQIGSNFEISIEDTARTIAEVMKTPIEIERDSSRVRPEDSEVERLWADNSKAKIIAGWSPQYGGLDGFKRGLEKTAQWFKKPENLSRYKHDTYNV